MSQTAPLQQTHRLADHVRACHVDGQVILLDLRHDRYIGVGGIQLAALSTRIVDWPPVAPAFGRDAARAPIDGWIDSLHKQGLLIDATHEAPFRPTVAEAQCSLPTHNRPFWNGVQWRRIRHIAQASCVASHWIRRLRLMDIATRIEGLRAGAMPAAPAPEPLRSAVTWYLGSRPFVMTSHDECLRDSLTLLRFLAAEQLFPRWVVGVRTRPFAAHSWVQEGSMVLNDLHETVRSYTPILVV